MGKRDEVGFCAFVCFCLYIHLLHICYYFLILVALSIHVFSVTGGLIAILTSAMILFPWAIMAMMFILQPMLQACARQLIEHIRYALSWKSEPLVIFRFSNEDKDTLWWLIGVCYFIIVIFICSNAGQSRPLFLSLGLKDHSLVSLTKQALFDIFFLLLAKFSLCYGFSPLNLVIGNRKLWRQ